MEAAVAVVVNVNGRIQSGQEASVPVFDHGFLYGEGIYETIRTYNGKPFLFDRHVNRLQLSAQMIALSMPWGYQELLGRVQETLTAWSGPGEAYIRILVTRGVGDLTYDPAACPTPTLVVIVKDHAEVPPAVLERGVKVALSSYLRNHPGSVNPLIKSNNLLNNALAMQEGLRFGAYESLMRNYRGELAECSQSNFFLVRGGAALTPAVESGLLRGVTRDFLFEIGKDIGVPVADAILREQDLETADEAFITSTTREVVPVVTVGDRTVGEGRPGPVTRKMRAAYLQRAHALTRDPQPQLDR
jgi:branched-chain amino acid aminotransferase